MDIETSLTDAFDRGGFVTRLADEIVVRTESADLFNNGPVTVNLNAPYGTGKTTFLMLLRGELERREHSILYFDAWQHDLVEEPLTGFISTISRELTRLSSTKKLQQRAKQIALAASKVVVRVGAQVAMKWVSGMSPDQLKAMLNLDGEGPGIADDVVKNLFAKNQSAFQALSAFRKSLEDYVEIVPKLPLIVLVDELDRCRPAYAIRLLETIKHLFNVDGIVFVVATNTAQLAHSVRAIYGEGFEAELYLKRFFSLEVRLPAPDRIPFVVEQLKALRMQEGFRFARQDSLDALAWAIESVTLAFDLSLRDLILLMPHLKSIRLHRAEQKLDVYWLFFLIALAWKKPDVFLRWAHVASRGGESPTGEHVDQALEAIRFEPRTKHQGTMLPGLEGYGTESVARIYVQTAFAPADHLSRELERISKRDKTNNYDLQLELIHSVLREWKLNTNPLLPYFEFVQHLGLSTADEQGRMGRASA